MKHLILAVVSLLAALIFSTEAAAVPAFARQTGMACSGCHYQHFPLLNSFGRAFKSGGFTMMGTQGTVEGDNLSIPNTLNISVLTTAGYEKSNQLAAADTLGFNTGVAGTLLPEQKTTGDGYFYFPGTDGELSLFFGGRVSPNAGFLSELGLLGANNATTLGGAKLPILYEVGEGMRAGIVLFTTGGQGASYGFETLNTGANAVHQMTPVTGFTGAHSMAVSAQQYIHTDGIATGASLVINSPMGFINLTKFNQIGPQDIATGAGLGSTYIRVAGTFDMAGWDVGLGAQNWRGRSFEMNEANPNPAFAGLNAALEETKATALDFQMQGQAGELPVGLYITYARAPALPAEDVGIILSDYNHDGTLTRSAFNIAAEVGVIPEKATVGMAVRRGKSGQADMNGSNKTDNAILLTANYKLAQNMMLTLNYTKQSGSLWDAAHTASEGSRTSTLNLFTEF